MFGKRNFSISVLQISNRLFIRPIHQIRERQKFEVSIVKASGVCQVNIIAGGIVGLKSTFSMRRLEWLEPSTQTVQEIQIDDKRCPPILGAIRNIELTYSPRF